MEKNNGLENVNNSLEKLGNFWMFFDDSNPTLASIKHKNPAYIKFKEEYPEFCLELHRKIAETSELRKRLGTKVALKDMVGDLSRAFDLMKKYVEDENTLLM